MSKMHTRYTASSLMAPALLLLVLMALSMAQPAQAGSTGAGKLISSMTAGRNFLGSNDRLIILENSFTATYCGSSRTVSVVVIPNSMPADTLRGIEALAFIALSTRAPITFELANTCSVMFGASYPHVSGASLASL